MKSQIVREALAGEGYKVLQFSPDRLIVYGIDLDQLVDILKVLDAYEDVRKLEKLSDTSARIFFY